MCPIDLQMPIQKVMAQLYILCQAIHGGVGLPQMALDTYTHELRTRMVNASRMFRMTLQKQLLPQDVCKKRLLVAADLTR